MGNTALTYACCGGGGYEDVVRILLDAGADVEHQNDNGHTPLMEAASCGHVGESWLEGCVGAYRPSVDLSLDLSLDSS